MLHALSVDVEEYYDAESLKPYLPAETPASRVAASTGRVLDLLDAHDTKATFFVLGRVATEVPQVVREIAARGHELACHHYHHTLVWTQSRTEFTEDARRAKDVLESVGGQAVRGFRAPSFSVDNRSLWALDVLLELGFHYDSSVFPIHHDRYGIPDADRFIHPVRRDGDRVLLEFPPATVEGFGVRFPFGGGGYLRQLPLVLSRAGLRRLDRQGHPAMLYVHPWEFDAEQPRLPVPWLTRVRHYRNLDRMEHRVRDLLRRFRFAPAARVLADWAAQ